MFRALFRSHPSNLIGIGKIDPVEVFFRSRLPDSRSESAYDMICLYKMAIFAKVLKINDVVINPGILNIGYER